MGTKASLAGVAEMAKCIDAKLDPIQQGLSKCNTAVDDLDVQPVVDLSPILGAISAIDLKPVCKIETRPIMDLLHAGLTKIEVAWARVDLREVLDELRRIDTRVMEAIVKIDAKDPARSPNFIWASESVTWA